MAQPERALPQRPRRSGPAKLRIVRPDFEIRPALTFQAEWFSSVASELLPLLERHFNELFDGNKTAPLEPNWDQYFAMEASGSLRVMTARCGDVLVGYIISIVMPHLFSRRTLHANIEKYYLDPAYRGGGFAQAWFKANDAFLKGLGVKWVSVAVKNNSMAGRVGNLFKRLGYRSIETIWMREL